MWQVYALLAAVFAALTAIFSKLGVRDVDSGLATAIRVGFILLLTWGMSLYAGTWREVRQIGGHTWLFLFLSAVAVLLQGPAAGGRLQGRAAGQAQRASGHAAGGAHPGRAL